MHAEVVFAHDVSRRWPNGIAVGMARSHRWPCEVSNGTQSLRGKGLTRRCATGPVVPTPWWPRDRVPPALRKRLHKQPSFHRSSFPRFSSGFVLCWSIEHLF